MKITHSGACKLVLSVSVAALAVSPGVVRALEGRMRLPSDRVAVMARAGESLPIRFKPASVKGLSPAVTGT